MAEDTRDPTELTAEQFRRFLEEETQHYFSMSVDQFTAAAERGKLPDHPVVAHLVLLTGAVHQRCANRGGP